MHYVKNAATDEMGSNRLIISAYLSNTLEFFEYTLFGALGAVIQQTYFQEVIWINPQTLTIFAFCISLLVRPIGSFIFGYIGDKISRLLSLQLSIACMTLASLTMALLPSSTTIGETAVWIVLLSRVLQGISAGGEYNGAAIFAIESYAHKPWKISGFLTSSAIMGLVLASIAALLLAQQGLPAYAWRIAFGFGSLIGLSSFLLRRVSQPPHHNEIYTQTTPQNKTLLFFTIFFIGGQTSALSYFIFVTLKNALKSLPQFVAIDPTYPILFTLLTSSLSAIGFATLAQQRFSKKIMHLGILGVIFLTPICLSLLSIPNLFLSASALFVLALVLGCHGATQHAYFQSFVPPSFRQRLISVAFSFGTGILSSLVIWVTRDLHLITPCITVFTFSLISLGAFLCITTLENRYGILYEKQQRHPVSSFKSAS